MSNETLFYTQIISLFTYVGIALGLYALLVKQKDATIQFLEKQLEAAKQSSPDILMQKLHERIEILTAEIERLSKDKIANEGVIQEKNEQIIKLRGLATSMTEEVNKTVAEISKFDLGIMAQMFELGGIKFKDSSNKT